MSTSNIFTEIHGTTVRIGVKEGRLYRFQGHPIRISMGILDNGLMLVTEDEEQEASKGEQLMVDQSSQTSSVGSKTS
jgi:hypothetical protein